jgi:hypothetical protein
MLSVNPETVCFIIDKAHQFHAKEQVVIPEQSLSPTDDWAMQVLADHADDPTFDEAKSTLADLEPDQQVEVVALLWLGRGDYELEEWESAVADAKDAWNENVAEYLFAHPQLADHLLEGLDLMGYSCNE